VLNVSSMPPAAPGSGAGPVTVYAPGDSPPPGPIGDGREPTRFVRILAWVVALPIALIAVGIPARKAGYLTGQKLLDVIVKHDIGRFVPLLVIVALWALVTAVLVTVFIGGARRLSHQSAAEPVEPVARTGRGRSRGRRRG
jgi:hypothetical protein